MTLAKIIATTPETRSNYHLTGDVQQRAALKSCDGPWRDQQRGSTAITRVSAANRSHSEIAVANLPLDRVVARLKSCVGKQAAIQRLDEVRTLPAVALPWFRIVVARLRWRY